MVKVINGVRQPEKEGCRTIVLLLTFILRNMKIVVYQSEPGSFQYEVVSFWANEMMASFRALGHEAIIVSLHKLDRQEEFITAYEQKPDLAFGFNGIGLEINFNGQNVHDLLDIPYLGFFLDHPAHHMDRLDVMPRRSHACFVDELNAGFYKKIFPSPAPSSFCPLGGTSFTPSEQADHTVREGIAFFGTGDDPESIRNEWRNRFPAYADLMNQAVEEAIGHSQRHPDATLDKMLLREQPDIDLKLLCLLVTAVERCCRAQHRLRILAELDEEPSATDIYGQGWEATRFKHHRIIPPISYEEALAALHRYRLCLNVSSQFTHGSHERVFDAALNGAVPVSNQSVFLLNELEDGKDCLFYDSVDPSGLSTRVAEALADHDLTDRLAANSSQIIRSKHLWRHRAIHALSIADDIDP